MIWRDARAYAIAGQMIRREPWVDRWVFFASDLWFLVPRNPLTGVLGDARVVQAADWSPVEFGANDWTTDQPVISTAQFLFAGQYQYLAMADWDASLQNNVGAGADFFVADGVKYKAPDWAPGPYSGVTANPGNRTDGHTCWVIESDGETAMCVSASGNFINAADNFSDVAYPGYEMPATTLWAQSGFSIYSPDPTALVHVPRSIGDFTGPTGAVVCTEFSDANGADPL